MTNKQDNRVDLSLNDFIDLHEFKKNLMEKGLFLRVHNYGNGYSPQTTTFVSTENAWIDIQKINDELSKINDGLRSEIERLRSENIRINLLREDEKKIAGGINLPTNKSFTLNDVKKFSIWQFMKWRKLK